jgi:hypothetical protein
LTTEKWSGWWDSNVPRRIFDPRPVAAATALFGELIQKVTTFAGLEETLAPEGFRAGWEFLVMDQFPWNTVLCRE